MMADVLSFLAGYLCGSIPFGLLLTRAAGLGDVRKIGSGNIGATNVLRTGNKKIAALTLILDGLKGFLPVFIIFSLSGEAAALWAGFGALAGHMFPLWLGFKGGKGVATLIGVLFGLWWPLGLIFILIWICSSLLLRISSASALIAAFFLPLIAWAAGRSDLAWPIALMSLAVMVAHRHNISRLMNGTESRIDLGRRG